MASTTGLMSTAQIAGIKQGATPSSTSTLPHASPPDLMEDDGIGQGSGVLDVHPCFEASQLAGVEEVVEGLAEHRGFDLGVHTW